MTFRLSARSLMRLEPVHPSLKVLVRDAIAITPIDFTVSETLRSKVRQKQLVADGASQTMNSKHLMQPDGFCHAVDLVALIKGKADWSMESYFQIADMMKKSAAQRRIRIRWGGAWNVPDFGAFEGTAREAQLQYIQTRLDQGKKYFLDGPHFELN